jgi:hypothetical protein
MLPFNLSKKEENGKKITSCFFFFFFSKQQMNSIKPDQIIELEPSFIKVEYYYKLDCKKLNYTHI